MVCTLNACNNAVPCGAAPWRRAVVAMMAVLMLSFALPAKAETHYKPRISLGGRAGVSLGRVSLSPSVRQSWLPASSGAVTFRYTEEKIFGLIAELGWTQRGWKENFDTDALHYSRTLTYLKLPVMTHIYFGSRRFKGFFNAGPEFGYMISDNISADFDYHHPTAAPGFPTRPRMTEQMAMDIHNRFDYGITAGLGCEFYLTPRQSVVLEARFYYGLGNIFPSAVGDTFGASRLMNIEVTLGYWFRLK